MTGKSKAKGEELRMSNREYRIMNPESMSLEPDEGSNEVGGKEAGGRMTANLALGVRELGRWGVFTCQPLVQKLKK